jgi:hypothetical protein
MAVDKTFKGNSCQAMGIRVLPPCFPMGLGREWRHLSRRHLPHVQWHLHPLPPISFLHGSPLVSTMNAFVHGFFLLPGFLSTTRLLFSWSVITSDQVRKPWLVTSQIFCLRSIWHNDPVSPTWKFRRLWPWTAPTPGGTCPAQAGGSKSVHTGGLQSPR